MPPALRAIAVVLCALAVSACVDSAAPILTDAKPVFGPTLRVQLFSLRKGTAHDPEQATYAWDGAHYAHAAGGMSDVKAFTAHPFDAGDFIVQSVADEHDRRTEYALMHRLADGVYLVTPVDEDDADAATRAANCREIGKFSCRVETQAQLFALARASAARRKDSGGLVIRLPDRD
jgi:folylpolyglutamate synthase/dihydropteroate synthase